ncbi:hypothetical protein HMPREF0972_02233 [Actinomyces sp. oral taxon 848 str. F0332]|nr:hypothetical protein HMPREF0972_02233 [Actinomyces sp. oral taxon 848 str. F0332]
MRESEFWANLDWAFPRGRGRSLAQDLFLSELGGASPAEALREGQPPQAVWNAVCQAMDLPESYRFLHRISSGDRGRLP